MKRELQNANATNSPLLFQDGFFDKRAFTSAFSVESHSEPGVCDRDPDRTQM